MLIVDLLLVVTVVSLLFVMILVLNTYLITFSVFDLYPYNEEVTVR